MKTLHIGSVLVVSALAVFACSDDDNNAPANSAGSASSPGGAAGEGGSGGSKAVGGAKNDAAGQATVGGSGAGESSSGEAGASLGGTGGQPEGGAGGAGGAAEPTPCVNDVESIIGIGGAGGEGGVGGAGSLELEPAILGTWKEESFPGTLEITSSHWNEGTIQGWDNDANVVYTQNSSCAQYSPRKFSKYVYTNPTGGSFYYCTIVFAASTLAEAKADTKVANVNDLEGAGCSGFPWSKVTEQ